MTNLKKFLLIAAMVCGLSTIGMTTPAQAGGAVYGPGWGASWGRGGYGYRGGWGYPYGYRYYPRYYSYPRYNYGYYGQPWGYGYNNYGYYGPYVAQPGVYIGGPNVGIGLGF